MTAARALGLACAASIGALAAASAGGALGGCTSVTARRPEPPERYVGPAGIVRVRWRAELNARKLFGPRPEECASGTLTDGRLVIGSRAGTMVGLNVDDGHVDWATAASGGIDSEARFDRARGQVYVGADDGSVYAIDAVTGRIRWSYRAKGAVEQRIELGTDAVYVATAADRLVALDAASGKWRWQYERETPEGFTIHGYGGPRLDGDRVVMGFADGYLVALQAATGEVVWARSLASASEQFVDVDSTPVIKGESLFAASYSGGVYALDSRDGSVRWRLSIEGAGPMSLIGELLYFATPRHGLHALTTDGKILWRQGLADAGDLTPPLLAGGYLLLSGSNAGLYVLDRHSGEVLEIFNPGQGICAAPTLAADGARAYILSNGGTLYALDLG